MYKEKIMATRRYPKVLATERVLRTHEFAVTKKADTTQSMATFLRGVTSYVSEDGLPTIFHFYLTKNSNMGLTDKNGLLDLNIPIIPAAWNTDSAASMEDFKKNATSVAEIKKRVEATGEEKVDERTDRDARRMLNYIKFELGSRYLLAKKYRDQDTMDIISGLDMMKGFDYDLLELVQQNPLAAIEDKSVDAKLTTEQQKRKYVYVNNFAVYVRTKEKYKRLLSTLEEYKYYDIEKAVQEQNVPHHSLFGRKTQKQTADQAPAQLPAEGKEF